MSRTRGIRTSAPARVIPNQIRRSQQGEAATLVVSPLQHRVPLPQEQLERGGDLGLDQVAADGGEVAAAEDAMGVDADVALKAGYVADQRADLGLLFDDVLLVALRGQVVEGDGRAAEGAEGVKVAGADAVVARELAQAIRHAVAVVKGEEPRPAAAGYADLGVSHIEHYRAARVAVQSPTVFIGSG